MAMGTRRGRQRQEELWVPTAELARPASHPFYERLNRVLDECGFDEFVEKACAPFYAKTIGRPGLTPGIYFRLLMVGYFEGIDSERGIAWRAADSLGIRAFLRIALDEGTPDHSTISRTRRLIVPLVNSELVEMMEIAPDPQSPQVGARVVITLACRMLFHPEEPRSPAAGKSRTPASDRRPSALGEEAPVPADS
jgi:transposase